MYKGYPIRYLYELKVHDSMNRNRAATVASLKGKEKNYAHEIKHRYCFHEKLRVTQPDLKIFPSEFHFLLLFQIEKLFTQLRVSTNKIKS